MPIGVFGTFVSPCFLLLVQRHQIYERATLHDPFISYEAYGYWELGD